MVDDIYSLFDPNKEHTVNEENLEEFASSLKEVLRVRLAGRKETSGPLRFSSLGRKDRQIWYDAHPIEGGAEELSPKTYFKFLYGDVIEHIILFLAKEAGHNVESPQAEVEVSDIKGHIDAIIDNVVVDVKSASPFGFKKFKDGTVTEDDPFGYVEQLSGYADVLTPGSPAAWIAFDKVSGDMCVSYLSSSVIKDNKPGPRIEHLKEVIDAEAPPERCYRPVPEGTSGNLRLPTPCSYCRHKHRCYDNLRVFRYSTGPKFFTKVVKEPNVPEMFRKETGLED